MDVARYMERLGLSEVPEPTLEGLNRLISAHQHAIPFEDLDSCEFHVPVSLDYDHLFEKLIVDKRGGYCFELNGLFCALLKELGFDAWNVFACVHQGGLDPAINHRGTLVRLDGVVHYVDVGKGELQPTFAVPLDGEHHKRGDEEYWMVPHEEDAEWAWLMLPGEDGTGEPYVRFSWTPRENGEFEPYNRNMYIPEDSVFVRKLLVSLRTDTGILLVRGDVLLEVEGSETEEIHFTREEVPALLRERFGIDVPW